VGGRQLQSVELYRKTEPAKASPDSPLPIYGGLVVEVCPAHRSLGKEGLGTTGGKNIYGGERGTPDRRKPWLL